MSEEKVIGFKEWNVVCDAIASGRQDLIFRKGGIHEGREGFSFKHDAFFLFPTLFHAQADFVTEGKRPAQSEWQVGDDIVIETFCRVSTALTLTDWEEVKALESRHIWTEETIKDRFYWEGKGMPTGSIHVAFLEYFKLQDPWVLRYEKKYAGCRSWIDLMGPPQGWESALVSRA